jgi:hypothetical protein
MGEGYVDVEAAVHESPGDFTHKVGIFLYLAGASICNQLGI